MPQTKRRTTLMESGATNHALALYARVSTEDQAERATIQSQLDFLRRYVSLHELPVAGEYVDDGISGTVPLAGRPEGQRLLIDAEAGRFGAVLVYRVDRLGRDLRALPDAHDALSGSGVAIRSGTEPIDTSSPIGAFIFSLLGSLAELEKSTISERTSLGRNRVASDGRYTGGVLPLATTSMPRTAISPPHATCRNLVSLRPSWCGTSSSASPAASTRCGAPAPT